MKKVNALGPLERARSILAKGRVVVLAGDGLLSCAGMQPPGARGGLWDRHDPLKCAVPAALDETPASAWTAFSEYLAAARRAAAREEGPSAAHQSIAALERQGLLRGVIALTTAGLLRAAGVTQIAEFFGAIDRLRCRSCQEKSEAPADAVEAWSSGETPKCRRCGGKLRPDMVLFEESMPIAPRHRAAQWVYGGRTLLILGANIRKPPMRNIPLEMRQEGGNVVAIGDVDVEMLKRVQGLWIKGEIARWLPELVSSSCR